MVDVTWYKRSDVLLSFEDGPTLLLERGECFHPICRLEQGLVGGSLKVEPCSMVNSVIVFLHMLWTHQSPRRGRLSARWLASQLSGPMVRSSRWPLRQSMHVHSHSILELRRSWRDLQQEVFSRAIALCDRIECTPLQAFLSSKCASCEDEVFGLRRADKPSDPLSATCTWDDPQSSLWQTYLRHTMT